MTLRSYDPDRIFVIVGDVMFDSDRDGFLVAHAHRFSSPVEGERARYACRCGAQAIKDVRTGELREAKHKAPTDPRVQCVQPRGHLGADGCAQIDALDPEAL